MATFTKLPTGKVVYTSENGTPYSFEPTLQILPHPQYTNTILITDDTSNQETADGFAVNFDNVTEPLCANRNELITTLASDFFNGITVSATINTAGLATDTLQNTIISFLNSVISANNIRTIDTYHDKVHEGKVHIASHFITTLAFDGSYNIGITTGTLSVDAVFALFMEGEAEYWLYETSTFSGGTPVIIACKNRNFANTQQTLIVYNPTITVDGTTIAETRSGSGSNIVSYTRDAHEWTLKPNTKYICRVINRSTQNNKTVNFEMNFYER